MESIVTDYLDLCIICNSKRTDMHHLLSGRDRPKCDADKILIPLCHKHHMELHDDSLAMSFSKMLAQAVWESNYYREGGQDNAREKFRIRYGKSFL